MVVSSILFLSIIQGYSQYFAIDQRAMILGGSAGLITTGTEGNSKRNSIITILPVFDYFIKQNLFIGSTVIFQYEVINSNETTTLGIGPEIGYAFGNSQKQTYPFLKFGYTYIASDNISSSLITIAGGIVIEIVKHVGIVGLLSYNIINNKYTSNLNSNNSISGNSVNLSFGIYGLIYK